MKIIKVFPRKTNATPIDQDVRINTTPSFFDQADQVHISVAFTWDLPAADRLYNQWKHVADTRIGGPALGLPGNEFVPGRYLKPGYVITSRGCPNHCWFCSVPLREPALKELEIEWGNNVLDDNFLACSSSHIDQVFNMLEAQNYGRILFTGGLEARLLTESIAKKLYAVKPKTMFFAYDTPDDLIYLRRAGEILFDTGFTKKSHVLRAYVLIGYKGDTFDKAINRLNQSWDAGFMPMAMLWRDSNGKRDLNWLRFHKQWARPVLISNNLKKYN